MSQDVERRVVEVVARTLNIEPGRIQPHSRFVEDLGAESMQSVELVAAFEDEFDIEMDEEEAFGVKRVDDAVAFIRRYL